MACFVNAVAFASERLTTPIPMIAARMPSAPPVPNAIPAWLRLISGLNPPVYRQYSHTPERTLTLTTVGNEREEARGVRARP